MATGVRRDPKNFTAQLHSCGELDPLCDIPDVTHVFLGIICQRPTPSATSVFAGATKPLLDSFGLKLSFFCRALWVCVDQPPDSCFQLEGGGFHLCPGVDIHST